jgi:hypothetical protein
MNVYLSLECTCPNTGYTPVSYWRGQSVGVGGRFLHCDIAPGEPVRRATQSELRRIDHQRAAQMQADWPGYVIRARRCHL